MEFQSESSSFSHTCKSFAIRLDSAFSNFDQSLLTLSSNHNIFPSVTIVGVLQRDWTQYFQILIRVFFPWASNRVFFLQLQLQVFCKETVSQHSQILDQNLFSSSLNQNFLPSASIVGNLQWDETKYFRNLIRIFFPWVLNRVFILPSQLQKFCIQTGHNIFEFNQSLLPFRFNQSLLPSAAIAGILQSD